MDTLKAKHAYRIRVGTVRVMPSISSTRQMEQLSDSVTELLSEPNLGGSYHETLLK
jgi:hypothetical protein